MHHDVHTYQLASCCRPHHEFVPRSYRRLKRARTRASGSGRGPAGPVVFNHLLRVPVHGFLATFPPPGLDFLLWP